MSKLESIATRNAEKGFALPTSLMFGLIILLVGFSLLIRSHDDRVTAAVQQQADASLNVADGGVSRVQAFLAANPLLALYNLSDWRSASVNLVSYADSCGARAIAQTQVSNVVSNLTSWQNIDSSDASRGQFRLANYTYYANNSAAPNSAPGRGVLEIEGRLASGQSTHRLRVTLPVQLGDVNGVAVPGLWLSQGGVENNAIQGNVLLNDCSISPSSVAVTGTDPATGQPYKVLTTNLRMPSLPSKPSFIPNSLPTTIRNNTTLPRSRDVPTTKTVNGQTFSVYEYEVDSLTIAQSSTLRITPGTKVTFYIDGSINRGGNVEHTCGTNPASNCDPTNFQIFGYGSSASSICLNGAGFIDAFILAPNYTVGVAGAGGSQGGIRGAVWANRWSTSGGCGSGTSNVTVSQMANWNFLGVVPQNLPPKVSLASAWERINVP